MKAAVRKRSLGKLARPKPECEKQALQALDQALDGIAAGIELCLARGIKIGVALEADFNIQSWCRCILAKNHDPKDYFRAVEAYGIRDPLSLGFGVNKQVMALLYETGWDCVALYNLLWQSAAEYLQEPEA